MLTNLNTMMMKKTIYIISGIMMLFLLSSCGDDEFNDVFKESLAPIPVNFPGAFIAADAPTFTLSLGSATDAVISIPIEIPESTAVTISSISGIAVGTTAINPGTLETSTFLSTPITVGGKSTTFMTTISELSDFGMISDDLDAGSTVAFIFELTLSDGSTIISREVEVDLVE